MADDGPHLGDPAGNIVKPYLLGYMILSMALATFFLLYFNRLFASIISWAIRTYTWRQYGIHIDIQAIQVSLLGGRIFFIGLRYHGNNESFHIQNGYITWSYWLRRVRHVDVSKEKLKNKGKESAPGSPLAQDGKESNASRLPCRMSVKLSGLEWFVYNRSAVYDNILEGLTKDVADQVRAANSDAPQDSTNPRANGVEPPNGLSGDMEKEMEKEILKNTPSVRSGAGGRTAKRTNTAEPTESDLPLMLQLFPIDVECDKAALVMGNENTRAILIVKAESLTGLVNAVPTETPDPYRQVFKIKFHQPVIEMKENVDFREDQARKAERDKQRARDEVPVPRRSLLKRQQRRLATQLRNLVPSWRRSVESFSSEPNSVPGTAAANGVNGKWQGLSRYIEDHAEDEKTLWSSVEYAALNTILESPEATMIVYWDVVAKVTDDVETSGLLNPVFVNNINGTEPPAWGISLSVKGGSVNYGPWADRQRAELQRVFFPGLSKDSVPATRLAAGAYRVATQFKLYVELEDDIILRVPVREPSKNWRYKYKEAAPKIRTSRDRRKDRTGTEKADPGNTASNPQRPYGWLDIKIGADATISYSMDMVAGTTGFTSLLNLDLPKTEISSSVNQRLLWRSGRQRISCDLSTPLKWNSLRQWYFRINSNDLELFLLRDHIFLLIDLVDDWSSGPPAEYLTFTPFKYHLDLQLHSVRVYLNVNDANIINDPTSFDDNTFIVIGSPLLATKTCISIDEYRPAKNAVPFDVRAETATFGMHVPPWNTQAAFLTSKDIGHVENLVVDGAYHYNATTSPANTDTLVLSLSGQSPTATLYGFVIRYFLKLKDNYFGDDVHFKTLEEYQDTLRLKEQNPEAELAERPPHKKSNDLDVILSVRTDDPKILLPANLYSASRRIQIDLASLTADLRFTNYYMDLDLVLSPLSLSLGSAESGSETPVSATSSTQLFIDGLTIYGHRLFGLPPTEPTYLCNWDLTVGAVTGECTADFLSALTSGGKAFGFAFDDDENALIPYSAIPMFDVTFLRVFVASVQLWIHHEDAAFLFGTGPIDVKYNDWARSHYSKRANITIPDLQISCVNSESALRHKARSHHGKVETDALLKTSLKIAIVGRKFAFDHERKLQQELVRREDQRTHRTEFLLLPGLLGEFVPEAVDPTAQPVPTVPQPTTDDDIDLDGRSMLSSARSASTGRSVLRHKSSFLSASDISEASYSPSQRRPSSSRSRNERLRPLMPLGHSSSRASRHHGHKRDVSASTRHSAFYSAVGDHDNKRDPLHNTVTFSSPYFAPYFPLENVRPDTSETMLPSIEDVDGDKDLEPPGFDLDDIDPESFNQDHAYNSVMLEMADGISLFLNPIAARAVAGLLSALQPCDPEDVLDAIQVGAMSQIFGLQKEQKMKGEVMDFVVRIPTASVRFLNTSNLDSADPEQVEQDQYDLTVSKLALTARSQSTWRNSFDLSTRQSRFSFQCRLASVDLTASERFAETDATQAAFVLHVGDVLASMGSKDVTYLDADIGDIQGSMSSSKIEYLASLIHRTTALGDDLGKIFSKTFAREDRIRQFITHELTRAGQAAADPTFLVRPSAVLRSAKQHLRTFDSWKLASRLRQLWHLSTDQVKNQLREACADERLEVLPTARRDVTASFERWRSWDLEDLGKSIFLDSIFGRLKNVKASVDPPFMAVVRLRQAQIVLDPGPKQNEITIVDLTVRFQTQASMGEEDSTAGEQSVDYGPLTVISICCGDANVGLNWELCELAEDILKVYGTPRPDSDGQSVKEKPSQVKTEDKSSPPRNVHVVVAVDRSKMVLDTVNLNIKSSAHNTKASLMHRSSGAHFMDTNFILNCDAAACRARSHAQVLTSLQLMEPSVFLAHELSTTEDVTAHIVKATASSRNAIIAVKQDPLMLLETLDLLVRDEVAQLWRLKSQLPASRPPSRQASVDTTKAKSATYRLNVALFLDNYSMSLPLLRSLTYNISGTVSRASMAADLGKEIIFDFDIKENSHDMQFTVNNAPRSISILQIPPMNGRVTSRMGTDEHLISVFASLELVQLDASAVYSLLSALNRPEISSTINEIQQQSKIIQTHVEDIFGAEDVARPRGNEVAEKTGKSKTLIFSVHTTFEGLEIFGDAPLKSDMSPTAYLLFGLDLVHFEYSNRLEDHGPTLAYPELHINLRQIAFEIQKGDDKTRRSCGNLGFGALITATSRMTETGVEQRSFNVKSDGFDVNLSPETISTVVDVLGFMGDKINDLDTSRELEYLRKLRQSRPRIAINDEEEEEEADFIDSFLSSIAYSVEVRNIQVCWLCTTACGNPDDDIEDLVLSLESIEFGTRTRNSARLTIQNLQLQMVPNDHERKVRSQNSALLPEVVFNIAYVSTADSRRLAFQAVGKSLDLRLTSGFIIPAANVNRSIALSIKNVQEASQHWNPIIPPTAPQSPIPEAETGEQRKRSLLGNKRLESLLLDADFAGAVIYLSDVKESSQSSRRGLGGKYGQFGTEDSGLTTSLRTPGLACKVEYRDNGTQDPTVYAEIKIDASSNILYPAVVPLIMDMTSSIKEVVSDDKENEEVTVQTPEEESLTKEKDKPSQPEDNILTVDPTAVLGRVRLNLGLRICKQEFSLSCQPIARVAATASFDDVYFTINTVRSAELGNFFAVSGAFTKLQASVQHVYSRESTGSFEVDSIVLSLMNSKHVSGVPGLSAILKVSPMKVAVNAKQLQDFLLFREIWMPAELRQGSAAPVAAKLQPEASTQTQQGHLVQRYQQVAATAAFPWTASISISALEIGVDLGQALGKSVFAITDFWIASKKTSDWQQNLCLGFSRIGVDSTGRMSGFVALQNFKLRTSIQWPEREQRLSETPLVQASIGFSQLRVKAAFDYSAFLVADITSMEFLMYNVRRGAEGKGDRLVASFEGDAVQVFGTTHSAAQGVALFQAFQKLVAERRAGFASSLREIEKFLRRKSSSLPEAVVKRFSFPHQAALAAAAAAGDEGLAKSPISLDTEVVVALKALNLGVFPAAFSDHRIFKMEALNAQARFLANIDAPPVGLGIGFGGKAGRSRSRIHSSLGLTLGQLRIGLAEVRDAGAPKTLNELAVEDVVRSATGSRGGTILKVPRVEAVMQTWQPLPGDANDDDDTGDASLAAIEKEARARSRRIVEYIFKSAFEGKVEVGWNYSRVSYIRGMWANHSRTLAQTWGRELPSLSSIKVTGVPGEDSNLKEEEDPSSPSTTSPPTSPGQQNKITAEVALPQSRYEYRALEPAVIETPQLRDMGEATPPLEWIGLHRERLPNLTHQIVIVALLELAGEVEDAYERILGSS